MPEVLMSDRIRSTTATGVRASPNTFMVSSRPRGLTISPRGERLFRRDSNTASASGRSVMRLSRFKSGSDFDMGESVFFWFCAIDGSSSKSHPNIQSYHISEMPKKVGWA